MLGEPGIPVYLRAPSRVLITLGVLAFGCAMIYLGVWQSWALVLVLCFFFGMTILGLAKLEYAIIALVIMSNFDGFLKPLFADEFRLFLKDYFILLAMIRWVWGLLVGEDRPSVQTRLVLPSLLFIGYVLAEVGNPNAGSLRGSLGGVRNWIMWIPVFFVAYDYLKTRVHVERLWTVALVCGGIAGAYGIVQYYIGFEHLYALSSRFEYYAKMNYMNEQGEWVVRVFSTMVLPGAFGSAMAFMSLVATGLLFTARSRALRVVSLVCLPLMVPGMFLSGTRAAWVSGALGLVVLVLLSRRLVLLVAAVVLVLAGVAWSMHATGGAVETRMETMSWDFTSERVFEPLGKGLDIALEYPFGMGVASGVGVARMDLEDAKSKMTTPFIENDLGRAFGELGILGGLLFLLLLGVVAWSALQAYFILPPGLDPTLAAALIGAMATVAASLLVGAALYQAPGAPYFWLALASVMRLPVVLRQQDASVVGEAAG